MENNAGRIGQLDQVADLIDKVAHSLNPAHVSREARKIFVAETLPVLHLLQDGRHPSRLRLCASLQALLDLLAQDSPAPAVIDAKARRSAATALRNLRKALLPLIGVIGVAVSAPLAAAPVSVVIPGSTHSVTYDEMGPSDDLATYGDTTVGFIGRATDGNEYLIVKHVGVGNDIYVPGAEEGTAQAKQVIGYYVAGSSTLRTDIALVNGRYVIRGTNTPITSIVYGTPSQPAVEAEYDGDTLVTPAVPEVPAVAQGEVPIFQLLSSEPTPPTTSDAGLISGGQYIIRAGSNGSNGRNGALFVKAKRGGAGSTGGSFGSPSNRENIALRNSGTLNTVGNNAAVIIASVGGKGGEGGDGYLGASGQAGGSGGMGGNVYVRLDGNSITTTGTDAHGVVVQSRAGAGGGGGSSYVGSGTGGGGSPAHGGIVDAEIRVAQITTNGDYSHGVFGQSLGGGGGSGGASYNLFGTSGDASPGGNGGTVRLDTTSDIYTKGAHSYGVYGQSLGGVGGDAGSSYALIAALGGDTAAGGNGGAVQLRHSIGDIFTEGRGSHGIFAQSIGGGGGNAGTVGGLVAIGGSGGVGGNAGSANIVVDSGSVTTSGHGAHGLFAQSIGGGGGNAGGGGGAVAIGGTGAAAGEGRTVTITNSGEIKTYGLASRGIFAQSIGGGGGEGSSVGGAVALGGSGAGGGNAGDVEVVNNASGVIFTVNAGADGILAQSVGGGGGVGGGGAGIVGLGSRGGKGGDSGLVTVTNKGQIITAGVMARGIMAQSIGGGGGLGGAGSGLVSTVGDGGSGGDSGRVVIGGSNSVVSNGKALNIINEGAISTGGNYSTAIIAQSIGGGGGDGANANGIFVAIGGDGGAGGAGGDVSIKNSGFLSTSGDDSHGILAQSIGGGGGNGGNSTSGGPFFSMAIGGSGGGGGAAGNVRAEFGSSLAQAGNIRTSGDRARGMILQSIGGGGGNGGAATSVAVGALAGASLSIGGTGGDGARAGQAVQANGFLNVATSGDFSDAVFLQSVGGGGGSGGFAISGAASFGPVGGAFSMSVGGTGGSGASGGYINWTDGGGVLQTSGAFSSGLLAQSIGGGGGNGGFAVSAAAAGGAIAGAVSVGVGGSGGGGGVGGAIDILYDGNIHTGVIDPADADGSAEGDDGAGDILNVAALPGDFSVGALIQSVGGGGGNGGMSIAGSAALGAVASGAGAASLGGTGGTASAGGKVDGRILGQITTNGKMAHGAVIQSVGGGGGSGGFAVAGSLSAAGAASVSAAVGIGGAGGGGGAGGAVFGQVGTLNAAEDTPSGIITAGDHSTGLIVQSIGGGGGAGGFSVAGGISASFGASASGVVGIGGAGGDASNGGSATGILHGGVVTYGDFSGGLLVQSVGGGGGAGGFNVAGGLTASGTALAGVVGLGGAGGGGGSGGAVIGTLTGGAMTHGLQSTAVTVQSIGGGGGAGGFNVTGAVTAGGASANAGFGLGGAGGSAGDGGSATGHIDGTIWTEGAQSDGVLVQSVGGGGGAGGFNVVGQISAGIGAATVGVGLGGIGGSGGDSAMAALHRTGATVTKSEDGRAIVVQSIGGGGGSGGFNVTGGLAAGGTGSLAVGVGLGGTGGTGGAAGDAVLNLTGEALTEDGTLIAAMTSGANASAIIAQSIGGGGGAGGFNVTGALSAAGTGAGAVAVGLGGSGGSGGTAGNVDVDLTGLTITEGVDAVAITAQSIGGGGGSGGFNVTGALSASGTGAGTVAVGIGGSGGAGALSGNINLDVIGAVNAEDQQIAAITKGDGSTAVLAQSIGGGGGSGGFNVSGGLSAAGTGSGSVGVGIGGSGGTGAHAGRVVSNVTGLVQTGGHDAAAIVAQSIGGGGGNGGFNVTGTLGVAGAGAGAVSVGLGGFGAGGGDAGDVSGIVNSDIFTQGDRAGGLLYQSIGGGGGNGGFNISAALAAAGTGAGAVAVGLGGSGGDGGTAGDVDVDLTGLTITEGVDAVAITAQSIGGGGGNGGFNVSGGLTAAGAGGGTVAVGIGGSGGAGARSGNINLDVVGAINAQDQQIAAITMGHGSAAVLAQSIGGGGGSGGFNVSGGLTATGTGGGSVGVGIGGSGGTGAHAGRVVSNVTGLVQTSGHDAAAIVAQSIGGGGGNGGFNVTGALGISGTGAGAVSVGLGGFGAGGGDAGDVSGIVNSDIFTQGDRADGLLYQSIGGGGGNGGFNISAALAAAGTGAGAVSVGLGGSGGDGGTAGDVDVLITGDATTLGDQARGWVAQSIGGGGGNGGFNVSASLSAAGTGSGAVGVGIGGFGGAGGNAGQVSMVSQGNIFTKGYESDAVSGLSLGGGGGAGGFNVTGTLSAAQTGSGALGVGIGGFGGDGGHAGDVLVDVTGTANEDGDILAILTEGNGAIGLKAQSIGGGGGTGGFNISGALSASRELSGALSVGIGGFGGGGGDAGNVEGSLIGDLVTKGHDAGGILAQSVGGGGGSGGFNVAGTITATQGSAGSLAVGIGGFGGGGGDAGDVSGTVIGNIVTLGDRAGGATYQSLGGGGGNGGFNVTANMSLSVAASAPGSSGSGVGASIGVGLGGFGGDGGDAGDVDTAIEGSIYTEGEDSYGALLQSAGGGGGNGGFNVSGNIAIGNTTSVSVGLGIGGFGGGGGHAGDVKGQLTGDVLTLGDGAFGAALQSLGGGGGNGGFNVTGGVAVTTADNHAVGISLGLGGFGGGGGHAGDVTGVVRGTYVTEGDNAMGVIAQSLGGGGGNGGINISGSIAGGMGTSTAVTLGLGGFGGGGGNAGNVDLTRHGATYTDGSNSDGVLAQSIGGGGGNGGINVSGSIAVTRGEGSDSNAIALGLGGFGAEGGDAGDVTAWVSGDVIAAGYDILEVIAGENEGDPDQHFWRGGSNGIVAQSVGGGGGSGGINVSAGLSIDKAPADSSDTPSPIPTPPSNGDADSGGRSRAITLGIGGFGGGGGHAGQVDLTVDSGVERLVQVSAIGDDRAGVIAQSLGGGGGVGGINISGGVSLDMGVALGIGGFGGDGGTGGKVFADIHADIAAIGTRARGVLAQSVGGGGGVGGINISGAIQPQKAEKPVSISFGLGGFGGAGNISDDVTVNQRGNIFVEGFESTGLLAQSVAGGGGAGGLNIAAAITTGIDSYAIAAGVGGFGGEGADAGDVFVSSVGHILVNTKVETTDDDGQIFVAGDYSGGAKGLHAQSIGGGGGQAGVNISGAAVPNGNPITLGVGGNGGSGGNAGRVHVVRGFTMVDGEKVEQPQLINTFGDNSAGLVAQSIGGGGGSGNYNVSLAYTSNNASTEPDNSSSPPGTPPANGSSNGSVDKRPAVNLQVGGTGAGAGSGDDVTVEHVGTILTDGYASDGLVAQSIGGGGGDAGANIYQAKLSQLETMAIGISLGGGAGAAGTGAAVIVDHKGRIETAGDYAMGVRAQSIGGGGGSAQADSSSGADGTLTNLNISIGRQGGEGGAAGLVDVMIGGVISTLGDGSNAVLAQSIGGGGGDSTAVSMGASFRKEKNTATQNKPKTAYSVPPSDVEISVAFGIEGGEGAEGGDVNVGTHAGTIIATVGDDARGILAQSIGGGGGSGGGASSSVTNAAMGVAIAMGGAGGIGAISGNLNIDNLGDIVTLGEGSDAILAQSIGGGGGVGGSASSAIDYSIPTVTPGQTLPVGKTKTDQNSQNAARAQNGKSVSLALGGSGGVGAAAGSVNVNNDGRIVTEGKMAMGIRAQSIGGGGGIAGESSSSLTQGERSSHTLQLAIGGTGGEGAAAGTVEVINTGLIYTSGDRSAAIAASSIGGGGGDASSVSVEEGGETSSDEDNAGTATPQPTRVVTTNSLSLGIGGNGGEGGIGNDVTVRNLAVDGKENSGTIITEDTEAYGILAQSIGGGGGNSSVVKVQSDLETTTNSMSLNFALGGTGGSGNSAGDVIVENSGLIETHGHSAHAILAQSIGGGGGNGSVALAVNGAMSGGGEDESSGSGGGSGGSGGGSGTGSALPNSLFMAVGGRGGDGGNGGNVQVDNSGHILTLGKAAHGIVAQSIGGGGGNAEMGMTITDNLGNLAIANAMSAILGGVGGGEGGLGGHVTVNHSGDITVLGEGSIAIKAESINGGGGHIAINMDEAIGVAKDLLLDYVKGAVPGAEVVLDLVDQGGDLLPGGEDETDDDGIPTEFGNVDPLVEARAGAYGAKNSIAGNVTVNSSGTFGVGGAYGVGSLSQAIGGGGGSILLNASVGVAQPLSNEADGSEGASGLNLSGQSMAAASTPVETVVDDLGGAEALGFRLDLGGIDGENNGGGILDDTHSGSIITDAINAPAILAQSIGGGGGRATMALEIPEGALVGPLTLSYGAISSDIVAGGDVTRTQNGMVGTLQSQSHAVILQSIGGGGGAGEIVLTGAGANETAAAVLMGADATTNADGGNVTGLFSGGIETFGAASIGLVMQSIGGGGGESRLSNSGSVEVSLGGTNGASGDGGNVSLDSSDAIYTSGANAHGVMLQSIGGGGGLVVSDSSDMNVTLNNDNSGDGGNILFTQEGAIIASGAGSYGVIAQSIAGGGGWVDGVFAGSAGGAGSSGMIDLQLDGNVVATNTDSTAIYAQSVGADGSGSITMELTGHVRGGSGNGVGIAVDGGLNNHISTDGSLSAVSGVAVMGSSGNDWIDNTGLIVGDLLLGAGDNRVRIADGASYIARSAIDLGGTGGADAANGANSFVNEGMFIMGLNAPLWPIDLHNGETFGHNDADGDPRENMLYGSRVIETVNLNGNFVQTDTGHMQFDVAYGVHPSDRVNVTGDATVDGTATITLTSLADSNPVTLFATQGVGVDHGLAVADTIALDYRIIANSSGVHLAYDSNFGQYFLRPNERALGRHMDSALKVGESEGIGRLMAALGNLVSEQSDVYQALFEQLNPEGHIATLHNQLQNANSFAGSIFGCAERATDVCHWSHGRLLETTRKDRGDYLKFDTKGYSLRLGTERAISDDWSISAAASYDNTTDLVVDYGRMTTKGEGFNLGLGARGDVGKLQLAATLAGGWSWYETRRYTQIFSETQADSNPQTAYLRGGLELAHQAKVGNWHFRPAAEISATMLHFNGMTERGAGTIGFEGLKDQQSFLSFKPSLNFGYAKPSENGSFGFDLTAGAAVHSKEMIRLPVRFLGSNRAADPAALASPMNQMAIMGSSRIFYEQGGVSFGLHFDLERGANTQINRYGANLQVRF